MLGRHVCMLSKVLISQTIFIVRCETWALVIINGWVTQVRAAGPPASAPLSCKQKLQYYIRC